MTFHERWRRCRVVRVTAFSIFVCALPPASAGGQARGARTDVETAAVRAIAADSLPHRVEAVEVVDGMNVSYVTTIHEAYRRAATQSIVGGETLARRFAPSALPAITEQVPGLFVTGRSVMGYGASTGAAGGMAIRGVGGVPTSGVLVVVDGMPQFMGLMGHPLADSYLAGNAESVRVVRGAASALYGSGAMGGVIEITSPEPSGDGASSHTRLSAGSYGTASAQTSVAMSRERSGATATERLTSRLTLNHNRTDGHRPRMGFAETGGAARVGYQLGRWRVRGSAEVTRSRSSNPGTALAPMVGNDADITRGTAWLRLENAWGNRGSVDVYHNFGRHDIDDGRLASSSAEGPTQWFHSRDAMSGVSVRQTFRVRRTDDLEAGAEVRRFGGRSHNDTGGALSNQRREAMWEQAAWVGYSWRPLSWAHAGGVLRTDHLGGSRTEWVPQLTLTVDPRGRDAWFSDLLVKASVGKGFRNPTIRELYMFPPSNPALRPERLVSYDLGVSYSTVDSPVSGSLTLFFIDGDNTIQTVVSEGRPRWENSGTVRNHGVEAAAAWRAARGLDLAANYSWTAMRRKVTGAPEHKLYLSARYERGGRSATVGRGGTGRRGGWGVETGAQIVRGLYTSVAPSEPERQSYVEWNLRAWWNVGRAVSLFARAENLLGARYETMAGYPMPGRTAFGGLDLKF